MRQADILAQTPLLMLGQANGLRHNLRIGEFQDLTDIAADLQDVSAALALPDAD